jgi:hypothetical protein
MTTDEKIIKDVLWGMYQENIVQGRHHETQRATVTGAIIAFAGLVINGTNFDKTININDLPFAVFLIFIGIFGAIFSYKQYERYLLHTKRAGLYRNELDKLQFDGLIRKLKSIADKEHNEEFVKLSKLKLHYLWMSINLFVALIGIILVFIEIKS